MDYAAAFALAVSGDVSRSRALADDLARDYPEDTSVQFMYLPTLRALFALDARDAAAAIQALQTASRFDLAMGGIGFNGYFGKLYPIGDTAKRKSAYSDLLTLWKNADPDVPVLKEARAEYARLP